ARVVEIGGNASHFLGSVVLAPSPTNTPAGVQGWLVVDGQQRLTTLSILLCAIRDHVRETDPQLSAKIDDLYLFNKYATGIERYSWYRRRPTGRRGSRWSSANRTPAVRIASARPIASSGPSWSRPTTPTTIMT